MSFFQNISAWFASKGGFAHVAAAVFASLMLAYAAVPQFHALVLSINAALPAWLEELTTTVIALAVWYKNNQSSPTQPVTPANK